jgi:hypothetical protein
MDTTQHTGCGFHAMNIYRVLVPSSFMLIILLLFFTPVSSSEGVQEYKPLSEEHIQKLKKIAGVIAAEIVRRDIKTIMVKDFTDIRGRPTMVTKEITEEFKRQLVFSGKSRFSVTSDNADAVVRGILTPFKDKRKWQLKIELVSSSTGKIITSYAGILKGLRG